MVCYLLYIVLADTSLDYSWYTTYEDQSVESTFFLPFIPQANRMYTGNLDNKTISLNATHPSIKTTEYNVHSLYGHMMSMRTHEFMTKDATYTNKG